MLVRYQGLPLEARGYQCVNTEATVSPKRNGSAVGLVADAVASEAIDESLRRAVEVEQFEMNPENRTG
jgi:hypothetical protein